MPLVVLLHQTLTDENELDILCSKKLKAETKGMEHKYKIPRAKVTKIQGVPLYIVEPHNWLVTWLKIIL